jgi:hypothetical protein
VPVPSASGLKILKLPETVKSYFLSTPQLVEMSLAVYLDLVDQDTNTTICMSMDAEWNISRHIGVSVIQLCFHTEPDSVYVIPVNIIFNIEFILLLIVHRSIATSLTVCLTYCFDFSRVTRSSR